MKQSKKNYWKVRDKRTGLFTCGGIDADFDEIGRTFVNRVGAKGTIFHYVYGFKVDDDGVRRFYQRRSGDTVDDFEAIRYQDEVEAEVIPGREMFTRNQLLNKEDRILDDLTPAELAAEMRKQF